MGRNALNCALYLEFNEIFDYDKGNACGKLDITIQKATKIFLANMKRIIKLNEEKYRIITTYIYIFFAKLMKKLINRKYF